MTMHPLRFALIVVSVALGVACSKRSPEPEPSPGAHVAKAAKSASLKWSAPASWTLEKAADEGLYRAKYIVPAQGNAPNPAEVLVTRIGSGDASGLDAPLGELRGDFEGAASKSATVQRRQLRGFSFFELEVAGTYKFPMGPKVGKRHVAQVMKDDWRALGVGVHTPRDELWFFRLVGPDDAVQAARSSFRSMLDNLEDLP